jgi:hypothetical protein
MPLGKFRADSVLIIKKVFLDAAILSASPFAIVTTS